MAAWPPGTTPTCSKLWSFIPGSIRRKYSWGIRNDCQLPFGFVLLKRKKSFEKGRSIISCRRSVMEDLLRGTAAALQLMVRTVWPEALGLESLPQLFNMLHLFLQSTTEPYHLTECNDDLVGFFNAVPQREIILSVQSLLEDFRRQRGSIHISVDLRSLPRKHIAQEDIPAIVQASFDKGIFWAAGSVRSQIDGTSIGNQISPVLSSLPVCRAEIAWKRAFKAQQFQAAFLCRYVLSWPQRAIFKQRHWKPLRTCLFMAIGFALNRSLTIHGWGSLSALPTVQSCTSSPARPTNCAVTSPQGHCACGCLGSVHEPR